MKVFSLKTKKHLVGWSVVIGFLIHYFSELRNILVVYNCSAGDDCESASGIFWPIRNQSLNILFWILVVFIILSLARYLRKKNQQISAK